MKKNEYVLYPVNVTDLFDVVNILNQYGNDGYRFVGWVKEQTGKSKYRDAIFEKEQKTSGPTNWVG